MTSRDAWTLSVVKVCIISMIEIYHAYKLDGWSESSCILHLYVTENDNNCQHRKQNLFHHELTFHSENEMSSNENGISCTCI